LIYPEPLFGTNRDALTAPRVADILATSAADPASGPVSFHLSSGKPPSW
jgi:hypothetical protein